MNKMKIKIHESRISRIKNQDWYNKWLLSEESPAAQSYAGDSKNDVSPYFPIYIDNPDNPYYDDATLKAKREALIKFIRTELPTLRGIQDLNDYFDFNAEEADKFNVDIVLTPKPELWDENRDDIEYITKKVINIIDMACSDDGIFSDEALQKKGYIA